ncbi:unnamed protein product [Schistocephalus solidus]|uniref:thioredoxin-disulfide reductase (NADPH) n=1 Tax=Schistocephalus solidus TaxID=70667 RepID=A0A183T7P1_SCHSO|nr:unnamed protein product [Schistocephalus solidus]
MVAADPELVAKLRNKIENAAVLVFAKSTCPFCIKVDPLTSMLLAHSLRNHYCKNFVFLGQGAFHWLKDSVQLLGVGSHFLGQGAFHWLKDSVQLLGVGSQGLQSALKEISGVHTVPQVFFRGKFIGGCSNVEEIPDDELLAMSQKMEYDYDLLVIGGGSGGLALAKESARLGAKVALLDYVNPTPKGTIWGLGGTCVNVGCIPKKLMHQAALLHHALEDAKAFGWNVPDNLNHDWESMISGIQDHIHSLNFGYRSVLMSTKVTYLNALGELIDPHTVKTTTKTGVIKNITARTIALATGERPRYPSIPGAKEFGITSDDLFSLSYKPKKALFVGASYVSLECAGFLHSIGVDVTVMVRSIFLRGFDQQMAEMIGGHMEKSGIRILRPCIPTGIKKKEPVGGENNELDQYEVSGVFQDHTKRLFVEDFDTVVFAIGRDPCTNSMGLSNVGVKVTGSRYVETDEEERTNVPNIYAVGDINARGLKLTPVAIQAGKNLARRLYAADDVLTEYDNIPTTVFTPLEYGSIGLSEEKAIEKYTAEKIRVYHSHFQPLEWTVPHRDDNVCYAKLICLKSPGEPIVGFHVLGPNAGEITQGYAVAMKMGFHSSLGAPYRCRILI